jgi:hypothetical protein
MKPLSELENNWRENANLKDTLAPHASAQLLKCADELQAWLRGWHNELGKNDTLPHPDKLGPVYGMAIEYARKLIQEKLLGTTRQEGEK